MLISCKLLHCFQWRKLLIKFLSYLGHLKFSWEMTDFIKMTWVLCFLHWYQHFLSNPMWNLNLLTWINSSLFINCICLTPKEILSLVRPEKFYYKSLSSQCQNVYQFHLSFLLIFSYFINVFSEFSLSYLVNNTKTTKWYGLYIFQIKNLLFLTYFIKKVQKTFPHGKWNIIFHCVNGTQTISVLTYNCMWICNYTFV